VSDDDVERPPTPVNPVVALYPQETVGLSRPSVSSQASTTTAGAYREQPPTTAASHVNIAVVGELRGPTDISSSIASSLSSVSLEKTSSDNSGNERRPYVRARSSVRPVPLGTSIDPDALATRSANNRDRVPPPPPKSHHGKLISPSLNNASTASQTTPARATNRVSFHGSSPGPLVSPRMSQENTDYFGISLSPASPADGLRRSQSQHKRPPTPPLSRRHGQMRRSKSTLSKPCSSQFSAPHYTSSVPTSPGSRSLAPSLRSQDSKNDPPIHEEANSKPGPQAENLAPAEESKKSGLGVQSNPWTTSKRASLIHQLPPPPPPRRTRVTNHNSDNNQRSSVASEHRADQPENFVPHPSNAKDILADLSRLQKEVDDLRGHYENRGAR
jgi:N-acetyltransferase